MNRHTLPTRMKGVWTKLERDYRAALADLQAASVVGCASDEQAEAYTNSIDAILLTSAETQADIRLKIEVMRDHEVEDGWWCAKEAIALLAIDAGRLLEPTREGGAA